MIYNIYIRTHACIKSSHTPVRTRVYVYSVCACARVVITFWFRSASGRENKRLNYDENKKKNKKKQGNCENTDRRGHNIRVSRISPRRKRYDPADLAQSRRRRRRRRAERTGAIILIWYVSYTVSARWVRDDVFRRRTNLYSYVRYISVNRPNTRSIRCTGIIIRNHTDRPIGRASLNSENDDRVIFFLQFFRGSATVQRIMINN